MKKSISYVVCKYDYTPDYEETYKGYKFTVGIELYGNIGCTIEFPNDDEVYRLFNIDDPKSGPNHSTRKGTCALIDKYFNASDTDIFGSNKDDVDQTGCLLIKVPFENRFTGSHQMVTPARLEQARRKYRASFKKYSDVLPNFINQQNYVNANPLNKKIEGFTDEEIISVIEDMNKFYEKQNMGIKVKYLTIESLSEICRQFIDEYLITSESKEKHSSMLDKIKSTLEDNHNAK